jgi:hypothetical protein
MFHPPPAPDDDHRITEKPIPAPKPYATPEANPDGVAPDSPQGEELFHYVNECLDKGSTKNEVHKQLIAFGYTNDQSEQIVDDAARWRYKNSHLSPHPGTSTDGGTGGNGTMWFGGLICLVGIVISLGSCLAAGEGGGRYTIAYGAIIWGAIMFFRGMAQSNQR